MEQYIVLLLLGANAGVDFIWKKVSLKLTFLVGIAGIIWQLWKGSDPMWWLGLLPGIVLVLVSIMTREALGMGDGLVMLAAGIYLGLEGTMEVLLIGLLLAALCAGILLTVKKKKGDYAFPFVPFLFLGYLGRWWLF